MPLGWHITVYRQEIGRDVAAEFDSRPGSALAVWQAGLYGLNWMRELVKQGNALSLGGNGYPLKFTAPAVHARPPGL